MGFLGRLRNRLSFSGHKTAIKRLDRKILHNITLPVRRNEISDPEEVIRIAEEIIESEADQDKLPSNGGETSIVGVSGLTTEEVAAIVTYGLIWASVYHSEKAHRQASSSLNYPKEEERREAIANLEKYFHLMNGALSLADKYHLKNLEGSHRPEVILRGISVIDDADPHNARNKKKKLNKKRKKVASELEIAKKEGDDEEIRKARRDVEKEILEELNSSLEKLKENQNKIQEDIKSAKNS